MIEVADLKSFLLKIDCTLWRVGSHDYRDLRAEFCGLLQRPRSECRNGLLVSNLPIVAPRAWFRGRGAGARNCWFAGHMVSRGLTRCT